MSTGEDKKFKKTTDNLTFQGPLCPRQTGTVAQAHWDQDWSQNQWGQVSIAPFLKHKWNGGQTQVQNFN